MFTNEAYARIRINQLLEEVGWRFFDNHQHKANTEQRLLCNLCPACAGSS